MCLGGSESLQSDDGKKKKMSRESSSCGLELTQKPQ